jgi:hypothetical protein
MVKVVHGEGCAGERLRAIRQPLCPQAEVTVPIGNEVKQVAIR